MYRCEIWIIKKAEHLRTDDVKLWCWRRISRVPCTTRRSNQLIPKDINPEYSLEGLMLKLKLKVQYFGHLMGRADSLEKTLMLGKIEAKGEEGDWGWDEGWMVSLTQYTGVWQTLGDNERQGILVCGSPWGCKESDTTVQLNINNKGWFSCPDTSFHLGWSFHCVTAWSSAEENNQSWHESSLPPQGKKNPWFAMGLE